jgi:glycogen debranching enzyme
MADIVQEIRAKHANGIHFREWNAGPKLDSVMRPEGFRVDVVTDWTNGFILGGNEANCGTWMDKMGTSQAAGNHGIPATPRDGAAVEIIGLLQSTLRWLSASHEDGSFASPGVSVGGRPVSWAHWAGLVCANFESWFYVRPARRTTRSSSSKSATSGCAAFTKTRSAHRRSSRITNSDRTWPLR